jgi:hypothetical protein
MFHVAFVLLLLAGIAPAHSQSLDDQERCATQARRAFVEWEADAKKGPGADRFEVLSMDYESHFNLKMKKCLMLIESTSAMKISNGNTSTSATLMDAFERHVYASYIWISHPTKKYWEVPPADCELIPSLTEKKNCASREEFDAFVASYLEK